MGILMRLKLRNIKNAKFYQIPQQNNRTCELWTTVIFTGSIEIFEDVDKQL